MSLGRASLVVGSLLLAPLIASAATPTSRIELGRQLFEENWLVPAADDSPLALSPGGDGLGPLFNGASCAECHRLGGVGGAGPNDNNVEIVSLVLPLNAPARLVRAATARAKQMHPEFLESTNVFLHRFGRGEDGSLQPYDDFRRRLRYPFADDLLPAKDTEQVLGDGMTYQLAQRNTPPLFGAGLIDGISPETVRQVAEQQKARFPLVAGRATDRGAGRFGWRGHVSSLDQFVRTACAEELGLRVRERNGRTVHDQPAWPVGGSVRQQESNPPADMTEEQVEALVAFVRALPAPRQVLPDDPEAQRDVESGQQTFERIGCAVCHVADLADVSGIYSDLLVHDVGLQLADRVAAPLPPPRVFRQVRGNPPPGGGSPGGGGGYSGSSQPVRPSLNAIVIPPSLNELTAATQEFRTPPLWGVADSAPYMHDGRAETLDDAIRSHAGQAHPAAAEYAALPDDQRQNLLAFLGTLHAPPQQSVASAH
jgi:CxxC motif-containing protein (DUF1111 family)